MSDSETGDTEPMDSDDEFVEKKQQTPAAECTGHPFSPVEKTSRIEPPSAGVATNPTEGVVLPRYRRMFPPKTPETPPRSNDPRLRDFTPSEIANLGHYQNEISP